MINFSYISMMLPTSTRSNSIKFPTIKPALTLADGHGAWNAIHSCRAGVLSGGRPVEPDATLGPRNWMLAPVVERADCCVAPSARRRSLESLFDSPASVDGGSSTSRAAARISSITTVAPNRYPTAGTPRLSALTAPCDLSIGEGIDVRPVESHPVSPAKCLSQSRE